MENVIETRFYRGIKGSEAIQGHDVHVDVNR